MAKVLLGISIALLLCAAGLGWVTKGKVEQKVIDLSMTRKTLATTEENLKSTKGKLEESEKSLAAANTSLEEEKMKVTDLGTMLAAAKAEVEKANDSVKEKETLLAAKDEEITKLKTPSADPAAMKDNPALQALQTDLDKSKAELAESKLALAGAVSRQKAAEEKSVAAELRVKHYEVPVMQSALTGNVVAVNSGWNFVVIDVGDKQGVTVNSQLLVTRGGQRIASLKITSVEPRTSIADVVPGTLARGQFVQPGDRVVFAGNRAGAPTAPLPPAETTAPAPAAGAAQ